VITDTLERARSVYDRLSPEAPTFTHGDFKAVSMKAGCPPPR